MLDTLHACGQLSLTMDDVSVQAANTFRLKVIKSKESSSLPIQMIDGTTFMHIRHKNIYFLACTKKNANPGLVFQFLSTLVDIFKGYFGHDFTEDTIRFNFTLIYELLDEVLDFGYPQTCSFEVLQLYINQGELKNPSAVADQKKLTTTITGARDWRRENIFYKRNEVFLDVYESVNLLVSTSGTVLRSDVTGVVQMKSLLSGMPECKLGLNDKVMMDRDGASGAAGRKRAVQIEDCTFHRCVQLGKFDTDRTITFVPPDGDFELMRYRITDHVNHPFRVIPLIEESGNTRVMVNVKTIAMFSPQNHANNVIFKIPVPPTTARAKINVQTGRAKYEPDQRAIVWRVRRFPGGSESTLRAQVELIQSTKKKAWVRPPISAEFQVPMFTASGFIVRSLKIYEKSAYQTTKWVRYVTRAGQYQIRI